MNRDKLYIYTIYDHPSDYPLFYVVRRFAVDEAGPVRDNDPFAINEDIEIIHLILQNMGLVFLYRDPTDDPCIIGSYI